MEKENNKTKEEEKDKKKNWGLCKKGCCNFNVSNITTAILLILAGAILLLNNFGKIPWSIWESVWKFWPVIIIIWGLELLSGRNIFGKLILIIISLALISFIFSFSLSNIDSNFDSQLKNLFPQWESLKEQIPNDNSDTNLPFGQKGKRVFRCDPQTGECKAVYK